jgi:hypothetical protein
LDQVSSSVVSSPSKVLPATRRLAPAGKYFCRAMVTAAGVVARTSGENFGEMTCNNVLATINNNKKI